MSAAGIAIIAENAVILAFLGAGWSLLRQGGGLQVKPVPVPKQNGNEEKGGSKP